MPNPNSKAKASAKDADLSTAETNDELVDGDTDPAVGPDGEAVVPDTVTTNQYSQGSEVTGEDQSANAKDYPEPQSAKGAFVNDEGVDLNTEADHTQNAQGNKYGLSKDALENYKRDAENAKREAEARIKELDAQIEDYDNQIAEA